MGIPGQIDINAYFFAAMPLGNNGAVYALTSDLES